MMGGILLHKTNYLIYYQTSGDMQNHQQLFTITIVFLCMALPCQLLPIVRNMRNWWKGVEMGIV